MYTKDILYSVGTRVVLGINQSKYQLTGEEPIDVTKDNVGIVLKGEKCKYGDYNYTILLDSGKEIDIHVTTSLIDSRNSIKIDNIEEVLRYNESKLEYFTEMLEIVKKNLDFLSKTELNNKFKKQENYDVEIKKQEDKEKKSYIKAIELRKEILACRDKSAAVTLVESKKYRKQALQEIGFSLNIMLWQEDIKFQMILDLVNNIWERANK